MGWFNNISETVNNVVESIQNTVNNITQGISDFFGGITTSAQDTANSVADFFGGIGDVITDYNPNNDDDDPSGGFPDSGLYETDRQLARAEGEWLQQQAQEQENDEVASPEDEPISEITEEYDYWQLVEVLEDEYVPRYVQDGMREYLTFVTGEHVDEDEPATQLFVNFLSDQFGGGDEGQQIATNIAAQVSTPTISTGNSARNIPIFADTEITQDFYGGAANDAELNRMIEVTEELTAWGISPTVFRGAPTYADFLLTAGQATERERDFIHGGVMSTLDTNEMLPSRADQLNRASANPPVLPGIETGLGTGSNASREAVDALATMSNQYYDEYEAAVVEQIITGAEASGVTVDEAMLRELVGEQTTARESFEVIEQHLAANYNEDLSSVFDYIDAQIDAYNDYQSHNRDIDVDELAPIIDVSVLALSFFFEPADYAMSANDVRRAIQNDNYFEAGLITGAALLPFVSGRMIRYGEEALDIVPQGRINELRFRTPEGNPPSGSAGGNPSSSNPRRVDLFGGERSQLEDAYNVDINAIDGRTESIFDLSLDDNSASEVFMQNPFVPSGDGGFSNRAEQASAIMEQAARVVEPGGRIVITGNPNANGLFRKMTELTEEQLEELGLEVVQNRGDLAPELANYVFRRSDGTLMDPNDLVTTVYRKVK